MIESPNQQQKQRRVTQLFFLSRTSAAGASHQSTFNSAGRKTTLALKRKMYRLFVSTVSTLISSVP
jgi:hypothetical protein